MAPNNMDPDWRSKLQPDTRQKIVNEIRETLLRHLPADGLVEFSEIIVTSIEEKIFIKGTSKQPQATVTATSTPIAIATATSTSRAIATARSTPIAIATATVGQQHNRNRTASPLQIGSRRSPSMQPQHSSSSSRGDESQSTYFTCVQSRNCSH